MKQDWVVEKWTTGYFNHERQAYVDSPQTLFTDANGLNLKAFQDSHSPPFSEPWWGGEVGMSGCASATIVEGKDIVNGLIGYMHNVPDSSSCCELCQERWGDRCKAWVWNDYLGGTCWYKDITAPLSHPFLFPASQPHRDWSALNRGRAGCEDADHDPQTHLRPHPLQRHLRRHQGPRPPTPRRGGRQGPASFTPLPAWLLTIAA